MDKSEYLIARVGVMKLGVYCRDVENVYSGKIKIVKLFSQGGFYIGIATINGETMQVLDLRQRIGLEKISGSQELTLITFNTGAKYNIALLVDEIIGMQSILVDSIQKNDSFLDARADNIGLLFPTVVIVNKLKCHAETELIHLLDSTYLDKTEPVSDDSGELELF